MCWPGCCWLWEWRQDGQNPLMALREAGWNVPNGPLWRLARENHGSGAVGSLQGFSQCVTPYPSCPRWSGAETAIGQCRGCPGEQLEGLNMSVAPEEHCQCAGQGVWQVQWWPLGRAAVLCLAEWCSFGTTQCLRKLCKKFIWRKFWGKSKNWPGKMCGELKTGWAGVVLSSSLAAEWRLSTLGRWSVQLVTVQRPGARLWGSDESAQQNHWTS